MTDELRIDKDGKARLTIAFEPAVVRLFRKLVRRERRSQAAELSYLIVERAREMGLDMDGHITE